MVSVTYLLCLICCLASCLDAAVIKIAWFAPKRFVYNQWNASTALGGLVYAIEQIQNDSSWLSGHTFEVRLKDSDCDSKIGIGALFDLYNIDNYRPDVIMGPSCSPAMDPVAQFASYKNIPVYGWISSDPSLQDKTKYDTLVRLLGPVSGIGDGYILMFELFGWRRAFLISTEGSDHGQVGLAVKGAFNRNKASNFTLARHEEDVPQTPTDDKIVEIYTKAKKEARIIILLVPLDQIRQWMLVAYDMEMVNGDYVFLYTDQRLPDQETMDTLTAESFWKRGDGQDEKAKKAYSNLMLLFQSTLDSNATALYKAEFNKAANRAPWNTVIPPAPPDRYSVFLYDAMYLYALALNETVALGGNISDGRALFSKSKERLFKGASGNVVMNKIADRDPDFWLFDMGGNNRFDIIAQTKNKIVNGTLERSLELTGQIIWGDGCVGLDSCVPVDVPECGFEGELCPNQDLVVIIVPAVIAFVLILVVLVGGLLYRHMKKERDLNSMIWKINYDDLKPYNTRAFGSQPYRSVGSNIAGMNFRAMGSTIRKSRVTRSTGSFVSDDKGSVVGGQVFISVANYNGNAVAIKMIRKHRIKLDRVQLKEMHKMIEAKHSNLTNFIGACIESPNICVVWEYCTKGSLQDVIWNDNINLDDMFKFSIAIDILKGLTYLHDGSFKCHGNLKSSNCVIDGRWVCKLADFGLEVFKDGQEEDPDMSDHAKYSSMFWMAPELLRNRATRASSADIYSYAIILKELFCRNGPYTEYEDYTPREIINKVATPDGKTYFRPQITEDMKLRNSLQDIIQVSWSENPSDRPSAPMLIKHIQKVNPFKKTNVMDNMIQMMEKYSNHLEEVVADRTVQLEEEKKKTETLLYRMLPAPVADELKQGRTVDAESFDTVSIYFSDIVSFTNLAGDSTPMQVVDLLNALYTVFDSTLSRHDVYKVETIGDAYMLVSGLPKRIGDRHVVEISNCALELLSSVLDFRVPHKPDYRLQIRIGLHTGPCVAGVVGLTMPRYCLFGDTVNTASRMESNGKPLRIHISPTTYDALSKFEGYRLADRGKIDVKGKGVMNTYWIYGKEGFTKKLPDFDKLIADDSPKPQKMATTQRKISNESRMSSNYDSNHSIVPPEKVKLTVAGDDQLGETAADQKGHVTVNGLPNGDALLRDNVENPPANGSPVTHGAILNNNTSPTKKTELPPINKVETTGDP